MKTVSKVQFTDIIPKYKNFIFDLDGVFYNGPIYLHEAFTALNRLKEEGKNIFILTNDSASSKQQIYDKLKKGGFDADMDRIFTASTFSAKYLSISYPDVKKVYVIGSQGIVDELKLYGIESFGHKLDSDKKLKCEDFDDMVVDEEIKAVFVGLDEDINFYKLSYASALIQRGAYLLAAHRDPHCKRKNYKQPGGGGMVGAVEYITGAEAYVVGKPNKSVVEQVQKAYGLDLKDTIMVGDSLTSDVALGKTAGIDTFLVLTGNTIEDMIRAEERKEDGLLPTYYGDALCL